MSGRFSKAAVRAWAVQMMDYREQEFLGLAGRAIDPRNGTAQLRGLDADAARIYGEWRAHLHLVEAIDEGCRWPEVPQ